MLGLFAKTAVTFAIPKIVAQVPMLLERAYDYFFDDQPEEPKQVEKLVAKVPRKKSDNTRYTQYQYDFIIDAHYQWQVFNANNPTNKKPRSELVTVINERLGLNKGVTSLATIWNGKLDRNSLAKGEPL